MAYINPVFLITDIKKCEIGGVGKLSLSYKSTLMHINVN